MIAALFEQLNRAMRFILLVASRRGGTAKNAKLTQEQRNAMMAEVRRGNRVLAAFPGDY